MTLRHHPLVTGNPDDGYTAWCKPCGWHSHTHRAYSHAAAAARSHDGLVAVTDECAEGWHTACPDHDTCGCPCHRRLP